MADRAASVSSIRVDTAGNTTYKIKVTEYHIDPELRYRRSITSDSYQISASPAYGAQCLPRTVFESVGGIIRGTGYVDPSDPFTILLLYSITATVSAAFDWKNSTFVFDVINDAAGSRSGYQFGPAAFKSSGDSKLFVTGISGKTDDGGMIEVSFELHSQVGLDWLTNLT